MKKQNTTESDLKQELLLLAKNREEEGLKEIQETCKRLNLALIPNVDIIINGKPLSIVVKAL